MCVSMYDTHVHKRVLCNPQFDVRGVAQSMLECKGLAMHLILDSVHQHGILQDAADCNVVNKKLLCPNHRHAIIMKKILPSHLRTSQDPTNPALKNMVPPMIFALPKWRSNEATNDFVWRNDISFANHPVRTYTRIISGCLSMLVADDPVGHSKRKKTVPA